MTDRRRVDLDLDQLGRLDVRHTSDAGHDFDLVWARTVCATALVQLRHELHAEGRADHLAAFERRVLWPATRGTRPASISELGAELGIERAERVSNVLGTVKRRFRAILRRIVAQTVDDQSEVDDELEYLLGMLGHRSASDPTGSGE